MSPTTTVAALPHCVPTTTNLSINHRERPAPAGTEGAF